MVSDDTTKDVAGAAIIVGVLVVLYELAVMGDLTPAIIGATLPVLGLGAALVVGGGAARAYVLRKVRSSSGDSDSPPSNTSRSGE
ncbi:hypothetical protein [Haloarchaeobius sp. HRN-SO-5]|uniref:hypothetical protein n=1 Tax=Haloarchaeobius sp. HRN-SO-5 TaxID=3446118 RepID=UPI003EBDCC85